MSIKIAYKTVGSGNPVIMLHGMFGSSNDWLSVAEVLSKHNTLIIPDLPGFGGSRELDNNLDWGYSKFSECILDLLGILKISSCDWVGYSLGGRIALHIACSNPQLFNNLVLIGASPGLENQAERELRFKKDQELAQQIKLKGLNDFFNAWYQADLFSSLYNNKKICEEILKQRLNENSSNWAAQLLVDLSPGKVESLWHKLPDLKMPIAYIYGAEDKKYATTAEKFRAQNRDTRLYCVPNSGHSVHVEQPLYLANLLSQILIQKS